MAGKKTDAGQAALPQSNALATAPSTALAVPHDELAELGDIGFDIDGLGEIDREDIRIAAKVFNFKGVDKATGRQIPVDSFYDTVDEDVKDELNGVFVLLHKTNAWTVFDNATNKTDTKCRSFDRVTGTMEDGTTRPCEVCPDAQWFTDKATKKRGRNCGPIYNMFAIDRDTLMPFVVRFKKTSLPVVKAHLQKHHLGKRVVGGKRLNYPLFSFPVRLTCKMSDDGKYALPVIERGAVLSVEEIKAHAQSAQFLSDNLVQLVEKIEQQVASTDRDDEPEGVIDQGSLAGGQGQDFNDGTSATA